jgi:hypothetical protein
MKIEIDLHDILREEEGEETLKESIQRQVVKKLEDSIKWGVHERMNEVVQEMLNNALGAALRDRVPGLVDDIFTTPFTPVDRYGSSGTPTTFRDALVTKIHEEMTFKPNHHGYSGNENIFTAAVKKTVETYVSKFKADFNKTVDAEFTKEALAHATTKLRERLGLK